MPKWIIKTNKNFLEEWKFQVAIRETNSTIRNASAGVSQGSVLGPLVSNLYMADIKIPQHCKLAQYTDDTTLYMHHRDRKIIDKRLQKGMNELMQYFTKNQPNEDNSHSF